jgi:TRAP transporter TAXI family solute receptor
VVEVKSMWLPAAFAVTAILGVDASSAPDTLVLLTGSPEGSYIEIGRHLADILEDSIPGLHFDVRTSGGSVANVLSLGRGEAHLAIAQSDVASHGARGDAMFAEHGRQDAEAIMGLHYEDIIVVVREGLGLPSADFLDSSHRLVVGTDGSGTRYNARDVLELLGLSFAEVDTIARDPRGSLPLLASDSADVIFLTGGTGPEYWDRVHSFGGEPLSLGEALVAQLQQERRYYQRSGFQHHGETVHTVRVRAVLLARGSLPSQQIAEITRVLYNSLPTIRSRTDLAKGMLPGTVRDDIPTRFHPGADAHYCGVGEGGCRPIGSILLLSFLGLFGIGFVALGFSSTLRSGLVRTAPRIGEKLVGPYGVTDRYRYLVIPVLIAVIILGGALLIQAAEIQYAKSHNVTSEFEDRSVNDNLLWTLVFTATGYEEDRFPRSPTAKVLSSLLGWVGIGGVLLLVGLITSDQLARRMRMQMAIDPKKLDGHVILCGWNARAPEIISRLTDEDLADRRQTVVVVAELDFNPTEDFGLPPERAVLLKGSPTDLDHMRKAGLDRANTLIVLADETVDDPDSQTVLTVLQAEKHTHRLKVDGKRSTELRSVAELVDPDKKSALESVHTDLILCPQEFSEKILLQALLNPGVSEFIGGILSVGRENEIIEVPVRAAAASSLIGKTFDEAMISCREKALLLLAINRGGAPGAGTASDQTEEWGEDGQVALDQESPSGLLTNPHDPEGRSYRIQPGDSLLFLAHSQRPLAEMFGSPGRWNEAFQG